MGWADCGKDSKGRPIGYAFEATCDEPGCAREISRGLDYACGGMHGEAGDYCERYFCHRHLIDIGEDADDFDTHSPWVCKECLQLINEERDARAGDPESPP